MIEGVDEYLESRMPFTVFLEFRETSSYETVNWTGDLSDKFFNRSSSVFGTASGQPVILCWHLGAFHLAKMAVFKWSVIELISWWFDFCDVGRLVLTNCVFIWQPKTFGGIQIMIINIKSYTRIRGRSWTKIIITNRREVIWEWRLVGYIIHVNIIRMYFWR